MDDVRKHIEIDQTKLDDELTKQASRYLYVAEQAVNSELEFETFKAQMGQLEASLDAKVRDTAEKASKKITEAAIRAEIERNDDYQKANRTLLTLRAKASALKALREAFYMRKDCLIQLAIKQRSEIEGLTSGAVKAA